MPLNRHVLAAGLARAGFASVRALDGPGDLETAVDALDPTLVIVDVGPRAGAVTLVELAELVGVHRLIVMSSAYGVVDLARGLGIVAAPAAAALEREASSR